MNLVWGDAVQPITGDYFVMLLKNSCYISYLLFGLHFLVSHSLMVTFTFFFLILFFLLVVFSY